jgi:hypothetical protein
MSDFVYVVVPGVKLTREDGDELEAYVKKECAGAVPHKDLSGFYVNIGEDDDGSTLLQPMSRGGPTEALVRGMVSWAKNKSDDVRILLMGYRGKKPFPPREHRSGTIAKALAFRPQQKRPHLVEFVLED